MLLGWFDLRLGCSDGSKVPSFSRSLFLGRVTSEFAHPFPNQIPDDERETLGMMLDPVEKFFENENDAAANDNNAEVPQKVIDALKPMGAFGLQVPQELGGVGLTNMGYARMVELVGGHDLGLGIFLGAHQSIGFKGILLVGTDAQKQKYLPDLAAGEKFAAFALTEPSSGSDANSIKTRAVLSDDGKHYILNGGKIWISNGGFADVFTVFAQTPVEVDDPKNPGSKITKDKVTAFIVERGFGGVTSGPPENKMGIKCSNTAEVHFDNTKVPVENVLGGEGNGFKVAMEILNNGRFGMGAALTGTMKMCLRGAAEHAANRTQFDRTIGEFELIQGKITEMATKTYAAESLAYMVAGNMDRGQKDYQLEAAVSKVFASEAAWYVADETIQILGGLGFMKEYPYERILRDLRIFRIFEGTNDILRMFVALTGLQSAGEELKGVQKAMKNPLGNLSTVAPVAWSLFCAKIGMPHREPIDWAPMDLRPAAGSIEHGVASFGAVSQQLLMKYGKGIIEEQSILERVANCVIDLTASTAVLARATRAHNDRLPSAEHEVELANSFAINAHERVQHHVKLIKEDMEESGKPATGQAWRKSVAKHVLQEGGYSAHHPLGM